MLLGNNSTQCLLSKENTAGNIYNQCWVVTEDYSSTLAHNNVILLQCLLLIPLSNA